MPRSWLVSVIEALAASHTNIALFPVSLLHPLPSSYSSPHLLMGSHDKHSPHQSSPSLQYIQNPSGGEHHALRSLFKAP